MALNFIKRLLCPNEFTAREWRRLLRIRGWRSLFNPIFIAAIIGVIFYLFMVYGPIGISGEESVILPIVMIQCFLPIVIYLSISFFRLCSVPGHRTIFELAVSRTSPFVYIKAALHPVRILILIFNLSICLGYLLINDINRYFTRDLDIWTPFFLDLIVCCLLFPEIAVFFLMGRLTSGARTVLGFLCLFILSAYPVLISYIIICTLTSASRFNQHTITIITLVILIAKLPLWYFMRRSLKSRLDLFICWLADSN